MYTCKFIPDQRKLTNIVFHLTENNNNERNCISLFHCSSSDDSVGLTLNTY